MATATRLNLDDFPHSPYANELRKGVGRLAFAPALEAEYLPDHAMQVRRRVRLWFTVALLITPLFLVRVFARNHEAWTIQTMVQLYVTLPCTVILTWLAWSKNYLRWYPLVGRVGVPIYAVSLTVLTAQAVAQGQTEDLAGITLTLIGVFFFSGLLFRAALFTSAAMLVAFAAVAIHLDVVPVVAAKVAIWLPMTALFGAVVKWDMELAYRKDFLEEALIGELVARDGLSGLMNRRAFDEHLTRVWQHALRDRRTLAVLMVDIDYFKKFNDTRGHQAGDGALRRVAQTVQSFARRPLDLAARYGGEEFSVILYDLALPHVQDTAERLRRAVSELRFDDFEGDGGRAVTVSVGVGIVEPKLGRTPQGAVQLADEALYEAKHSGRNCVVVKGAEEYSGLTTGSFKTPKFDQRQRSDAS